MIGGIGVFTKNVENELFIIKKLYVKIGFFVYFLRKTKKADIAVHSLKDLPTIIDEDLIIGAIPRL